MDPRVRNQFFLTIQECVLLPNFVFAEEELSEVGEVVQILNLADLVVAQLQHLQLGKVLQVLNLGDLVGDKVQPLQVGQVLQPADVPAMKGLLTLQRQCLNIFSLS